VNPDQPCTHEHFAVHAEVNRILDNEDNPVPIAYTADITATCEDCGELFRWTGVPAGLSSDRPTCNVDETVLHAPLRPASADPDFGMGLPGFAIHFVEGGSE
jgi:hypothetical protein